MAYYDRFAGTSGKTGKERNVLHTIRRMRERYGLTREEFVQVQADPFKYHGRLEKLTNTRYLVWYPWGDRDMMLVYSMSTNEIVTVLPEGSEYHLRYAEKIKVLRGEHGLQIPR